MKEKHKIYSTSNEEFIRVVLASKTYAEVLRAYGLCTTGGHTIKKLKQRINELEIDISHFDSGAHARTKGYGDITPIEHILIENSTYFNIASLKRRLIRENVLDYICDECGNKGEWNNKPLSLQLDHINGIHNDHRKENLRFLCPNCHSQTDTYAGKNKGV